MMDRRGVILALGAVGVVLPWPRPAGASEGGRETLHLAPDGEDSDAPGAGRAGRPFASLPHAYRRARPGDTILMRGGVYRPGGTEGWLLHGGGGAPGRPVRIEAMPGETPVVDGATMTPPTGAGAAWPGRNTAGGFPLVLWDAPFVEVRGLAVRHGPMGGMHVSGTHPGFVAERCAFHENGWLNDEHGVGLGIFGSGGANVVRNCDAWGNHGGGVGATGGNADGFQIVLADSAGTVVTGNRAWHNGDDGFDFFNTLRPGDDRSVTGYLVDGNWSFANGCRPDGTVNPTGDGVGFKLGGRRQGARGRHGGHTVIRNLAWANRTMGFDENGYLGGTEPHRVWNNVAFDNGRDPDGGFGDHGHAFVFQDAPGTVLANNVAFALRTRNEVLVKRAVERCNARNGRPWNVFHPALTLGADAFVSLEDAVARGPRGPDGSLPASGFLRPVRGGALTGRGADDGAPAELGASKHPDLGAYPTG